MSDLLLETAAENFDGAQKATGIAQMQLIALGLMQLARAAKDNGRNIRILDVAADNFQSAQFMHGEAQVRLIALGLTQYARGLKR